MATTNVNDIYNILLYIVRKQRGVFLTTSESDLVLDRAQLELFADSFAQYQINQKIVDALSPFKTVTQFTTSSSGEVTQPSDYQHLLGSVYTVTGSTVNAVRFVNEDELPLQLTGQLRPISLSSPIAIDSANGFQLYPQSTQTGFYTYLRRPVKPYLATTQVGRTITYDPVLSVQLEFYDVYINNIISRALKYLGINMSEAEIEQFAQSQQQQTN
jgi:hypothetical protein